MRIGVYTRPAVISGNTVSSSYTMYDPMKHMYGKSNVKGAAIANTYTLLATDSYPF